MRDMRSVRYGKGNDISVKQLKSNLHAAVSRQDFAPAADFIADRAMPCLRFCDLGSFDGAPLGATRFGGDPDLPAGFEWPVDPDGPSGQNALLFVAQFDFAELPLWDSCSLPESGLLSLFTGLGGLQGFSTAFHFPSTESLERRSTPLSQLGPEYKEENHLQPCRVEAKLALSIPASIAHFRDKVVELCSDVDWIDPEYPEIDDDLIDFENQTGPDEWFSQMLGYAVPPYLPRCNYHEKAAAKQLGVNAYAGPRGAFSLTALSPEERLRVESESLNFPLLLSVKSGGTTGAMWSDCGTLHALAHDDRIRSRDLSWLPTFVYH